MCGKQSGGYPQPQTLSFSDPTLAAMSVGILLPASQNVIGLKMKMKEGRGARIFPFDHGPKCVGSITVFPQRTRMLCCSDTTLAAMSVQGWEQWIPKKSLDWRR
eukprot:gnl/MRDRNA2_/MRDRNA2_212858_c0_seq1.p1 gnl/MRDRNA2_/MRDRNA2_212858_c0~~gnl/MRDRNA2_/MRDRNA2_212858_c0_seq1.p1  ORF type:complete len:104 (+),score=11.74 gnl/MRDRNA2_/MRDRNA2_212858_c0_seq1:86-397(+)